MGGWNLAPQDCRANDRELAREAGFDHDFSKPVDFDALLALIAAGTERV